MAFAYPVLASIFPGAVAPASWKEFIDRVDADPGITTASLEDKVARFSDFSTLTLSLVFDVEPSVGEKAIIDALAAAAPGPDIYREERPYGFTVAPPHAAGDIDMLAKVERDISITRIAITGLTAVDTGDWPINVRVGSGIDDISTMTLAGTVTLEAGSLQENETVLAVPVAVAAGEYIALEFGTITGTWATEASIMVYVYYSKA